MGTYHNSCMTEGEYVEQKELVKQYLQTKEHLKTTEGTNT